MHRVQVHQSYDSFHFVHQYDKLVRPFCLENCKNQVLVRLILTYRLTYLIQIQQHQLLLLSSESLDHNFLVLDHLLLASIQVNNPLSIKDRYLKLHRYKLQDRVNQLYVKDCAFLLCEV